MCKGKVQTVKFPAPLSKVGSCSPVIHTTQDSSAAFLHERSICSLYSKRWVSLLWTTCFRYCSLQITQEKNHANFSSLQHSPSNSGTTHAILLLCTQHIPTLTAVTLPPSYSRDFYIKNTLKIISQTC